MNGAKCGSIVNGVIATICSAVCFIMYALLAGSFSIVAAHCAAQQGSACQGFVQGFFVNLDPGAVGALWVAVVVSIIACILGIVGSSMTCCCDKHAAAKILYIVAFVLQMIAWVRYVSISTFIWPDGVMIAGLINFLVGAMNAHNAAKLSAGGSGAPPPTFEMKSAA